MIHDIIIAVLRSLKSCIFSIFISLSLSYVFADIAERYTFGVRLSRRGSSRHRISRTRATVAAFRPRPCAITIHPSKTRRKRIGHHRWNFGRDENDGVQLDHEDADQHEDGIDACQQRRVEGSFELEIGGNVGEAECRDEDAAAERGESDEADLVVVVGKVAR